MLLQFEERETPVTEPHRKDDRPTEPDPRTPTTIYSRQGNTGDDTPTEPHHQITTTSQQEDTGGGTNIDSDPGTEPGTPEQAWPPPPSNRRMSTVPQQVSGRKVKPSQTDTETRLENIEDEEID